MAHQTTSMRMRGFTLIELMITVAIVAILASIALPAYRDSVLKGKRAQGRTALLELAQAQERWFTANGSYQSFSVGASVTGMKTYSGDNPSTAAYKLSSAACANSTTGECVLLTAVPQQPDPDAGSLTLTTTGAKSCSGSKPAVCWP